MKAIKILIRTAMSRWKIILSILLIILCSYSVVGFVLDNNKQNNISHYYKNTLVTLPDHSFCDEKEAVSYLKSKDFFTYCYDILLNEEWMEENFSITQLEKSTRFSLINYYGEAVDIYFASNISSTFVNNASMKINSCVASFLQNKYQKYSSMIKSFFTDSSVFVFYSYNYLHILYSIVLLLTVVLLLFFTIKYHRHLKELDLDSCTFFEIEI